MPDKNDGEAQAPKPQAPPERPPLTVATNADEKPHTSTVTISIRKEQ